MSYAVNEKLFGHTAHRAVGTTNGIAGDIALNAAHPAASRVGQIVVNVEQLHSDNNLRDARMRAAEPRLARLPAREPHRRRASRACPRRSPTARTYHFTMTSQLTVKKTPGAGHVERRRDASPAASCTATATTNVKMSTFGIGPISIAGLVSTSDDVTLTMKLTALDPSKFTIPTRSPRPRRRRAPNDSPSFDERDHARSLQANCASCHNPGQVGAAHWTLDTAADAAKISDGIGSVVGAGYMPPWPASPHGVALLELEAPRPGDDRRAREVVEGRRPARRARRRRRSRRRAARRSRRRARTSCCRCRRRTRDR